MPVCAHTVCWYLFSFSQASINVLLELLKRRDTAGAAGQCVVTNDTLSSDARNTWHVCTAKCSGPAELVPCGPADMAASDGCCIQCYAMLGVLALSK